MISRSPWMSPDTAKWQMNFRPHVWRLLKKALSIVRWSCPSDSCRCTPEIFVVWFDQWSWSSWNNFAVWYRNAYLIENSRYLNSIPVGGLARLTEEMLNIISITTWDLKLRMIMSSMIFIREATECSLPLVPFFLLQLLSMFLHCLIEWTLNHWLMINASCRHHSHCQSHRPKCKIISFAFSHPQETLVLNFVDTLVVHRGQGQHFGIVVHIAVDSSHCKQSDCWNNYENHSDCSMNSCCPCELR